MVSQVGSHPSLAQAVADSLPKQPKTRLEQAARLQVLDDIGIDLQGKMTAAPRSKLRQGQAAAASTSSQQDEDLMARLAALK